MLALTLFLLSAVAQTKPGATEPTPPWSQVCASIFTTAGQVYIPVFMPGATQGTGTGTCITVASLVALIPAPAPVAPVVPTPVLPTILPASLPWTAPITTVTLTCSTVTAVFFNQAFMTPGRDYTISGTTLTFINGVSPGSVNPATDSVAITYPSGCAQ